jgi:hypothetical protein
MGVCDREIKLTVDKTSWRQPLIAGKSGVKHIQALQKHLQNNGVNVSPK